MWKILPGELSGVTFCRKPGFVRRRPAVAGIAAGLQTAGGRISCRFSEGSLPMGKNRSRFLPITLYETRENMPIEISDKTIKREFIERLAKLSGQDVYKCFQCGTCAGACPMSGHMDSVPRKVMRMAQLGMEERVGETRTCWTCASCHTCTVNCPRGIDIARVMEAIRLLTLRKNVNLVEPSKLPAETVKELPQIALVSCFRKLTS